MLQINILRQNQCYYLFATHHSLVFTLDSSLFLFTTCTSTSIPTVFITILIFHTFRPTSSHKLNFIHLLDISMQMHHSFMKFNLYLKQNLLPSFFYLWISLSSHHHCIQNTGFLHQSPKLKILIYSFSFNFTTNMLFFISRVFTTELIAVTL